MLRRASLLALTLVACGAPKTPSSPGEICAAPTGQTRPLVVEWSAPERTDLEARAGQGPIVVKRAGCSIEILRGCRAPGAYRFTPVTPKRDRVIIRDAAELYTNLPFGAAKLQARLGESGRLDVDMTVVGQYELDRTRIASAELGGDCDGATHVITALTAGAFTLLAGAESEASGGVEVTGIGAGASERHGREVLSRDGRAEACARAAAGDTKPPEGCAALVRIELVPLGDVRRETPSCPPTWAWNGVQCERPVAIGSDAPMASASATPGSAPSTTPPSTAAGSMITIPGGSFRLGTSGWHQSFGPQHLVSVAPFAIDTTEVTVAEYRRCVQAGACVPPASGGRCTWSDPARGDHPINCVEWQEASTYCKWAGKRLPTEEEWEFAALGQTGHRFPWGNEPPTGARLCWSGGKRAPDEPDGTCAVLRHADDKSAFGVIGLGANVAEWTSSASCKYPKKEHLCDESQRIVRGDDWTDLDSSTGRSVARFPYPSQGKQSSTIGFRCAKSL